MRPTRSILVTVLTLKSKAVNGDGMTRGLGRLKARSNFQSREK